MIDTKKTTYGYFVRINGSNESKIFAEIHMGQQYRQYTDDFILIGANPHIIHSRYDFNTLYEMTVVASQCMMFHVFGKDDEMGAYYYETERLKCELHKTGNGGICDFYVRHKKSGGESITLMDVYSSPALVIDTISNLFTLLKHYEKNISTRPLNKDRVCLTRLQFSKPNTIEIR